MFKLAASAMVMATSHMERDLDRTRRDLCFPCVEKRLFFSFYS